MILRLILCVVLLSAPACAEDRQDGSTNTRFGNVKVGLFMTTGGQGGTLAGPSVGAANIAIDHLKARGAKLTIEQADYQGDLSLAPALIDDLEKKVDAIVVATDDPEALPALEGVEVPVVHAYITKEGVTSRNNVFRVAASDSMQARTLARFLAGHRELARFGIVHENSEYGTAGAADFTEAVEDAGATVVASRGFDPGGDIHTPLMVADDFGAQAVVIWTDDPAEAARAVIDAHRSTLSYQIALPGNAAVPEFGKNAVAQVVPTAFREGIVSVGPWAGPWTRTGRISRFYRDFEEKQNDLAPVRTAQVYDAVMMISAAKARGDISTGLASLEDFTGASVPVTFDDDREGMDETDLGAWGFTKSETGAGSEFFPAVDTGGGFFTLIPNGIELPRRYAHLIL